MGRHRLTGCRVPATDRAAAKTSYENGGGVDGGFRRPETRATDFLDVEMTCENFSEAKLHGTTNEPIFTQFLGGPPQTISVWI